MSDNGNRRGDPKTPGGGNKGNRSMRTMSFWFIMVILLFIAIQLINYGKPQEFKVSYTKFMEQLEEDNLQVVNFDGDQIKGVFRRPVTINLRDKTQDVERYYLPIPYALPHLLEQIRTQSSEEYPIIIDTEEQGFNWLNTLAYWAPILLLVFLWFFFIRQMQGGSNRAFSFGKSRAKLVGGDKSNTTFDDVAGAEEAKVELCEIVEFLSDPKKFKRMGARIPRGALLIGPPGTGKTLLAKAVAGEAKVPFYSMSGSDFVEMFVGVGASRVRDLFEQGKKNAPCIIFVDELDAVGRHRGAGLGGGHDEREQTLNQLLVEMDGFDTSDGVILLAATNRPDVLDPALLRPGRFDRQIMVDMPDLKGREGIIKVHLKNVPIADDVDIRVLASGTPGLSGADLANMVNEGAILAARRDHDKTYMDDFEDAKDKVMLGPERKGRVIKEETRKMTAYHEAGHAIVGVAIPEADKLHKVTIISRGRAAGVTHFLPEEDRFYHVDKEYIMARLTMAMGGIVAEKMIYDTHTSGGSNDIKQATEMARRMVTQWGMSKNLGPIAYGGDEETVFLGRSIQNHKNFSERTAQLIDEEILAIMTEAEARCRKIIEDNIDSLHKLADALMDRETVSGDEVDMILRGEELPFFDKEAAEAARQRQVDSSMSTADKIEAALAGGGDDDDDDPGLAAVREAGMPEMPTDDDEIEAETKRPEGSSGSDTGD